MTPNLTLNVHSGDAFDVRRFEVSERISNLFEARIIALSENADVTFDDVVGRPARFSLDTSQSEPGALAERTWSGICQHIEVIATEQTGLSTYAITIVPELWLTSQRRNYRIFQTKSEPEIVAQILDEWGIAHEMRIDPGAYEKRKYRVQYAESDFAFICRLLEDVGVSFVFEPVDGASKLVLADAPQSAERRAKLPYYEDPDSTARQSLYVSKVSVGQRVRPGRYTMRDLDYRRPPDYPLMAGASESANDVEDRLERFHYVPGAFLFGGADSDTPQADDKGAFRADEDQGAALVQKRLEAKRATAKMVTFQTNAHDLAPGTVLGFEHHPRRDLHESHPLLVLASHLEGTHEDEWIHRCEACSAEQPFRPRLTTDKPKVQGVESATVVGPAGEEIHTDEFGRIRVHFHWDRSGKVNDDSSCWIPVSQPWSGSGYGAVNLPRIGQEVLVDFLGGDPDRPVVVGRVYTRLQGVPYSLPGGKTRSGWKSMSSPGGGGYNEIAFEDDKGKERLEIQAERDLVKLVKNNETERVLNARTVSVGSSRSTTVGTVDSLIVGDEHKITMVQKARDAAGAHEMSIPPTGTTMRDEYVKLTTGGASITMDGSRVTITAATIALQASEGVYISSPNEVLIGGGEKVSMGSGGGNVQIQAPSGEVSINGGPMVKINS